MRAHPRPPRPPRGFSGGRPPRRPPMRPPHHRPPRRGRPPMGCCVWMLGALLLLAGIVSALLIAVF